MSQKILKAMRAALSMTIQRCHNPKCRDYRYYGGRGISVCQRWRDSFRNFLEDMGLRPEGLTLERRDNDGPYSKANCVWASRKQQSANQRSNVVITYAGRTLGLTAWAELTGIPYNTLKARVGRLGYTPEQALTKPVKCGGLLPGKVYRKRRPPDMSKVPRGLDSALTKLSRAQVLRMRQMHSQGHTFTSLGSKFGVSTETASQAVQAHGAYKEI